MNSYRKSINPTGVSAVVVCYYPDNVILLNQFRSIRYQVDNIIYVINESEGDSKPFISVVKHLPGVHVIRNRKNEGVSCALNQGIRHGKIIHSSYSLLLDQDSVPYPDMVKNLLSAYKLLKKNRIAAVGPVCIDPVSKDDSYFVRFGKFRFKKIYCGTLETAKLNIISSDFLISSGTLIKNENIEKIGGMDKNLFIDHVDTEWFLRAKSLGYEAFGVCNAFMEHTLGDKRKKIWIGKWLRIPHHSPQRHYYQFRNSMILMRRSYAGCYWKIGELRRLLMIFLYFSFFSDQNYQNFKKMTMGILDGIALSKSLHDSNMSIY